MKVKRLENQPSGISSLYVIETINAIGHCPVSWILDSGATSHICVCMQDLKESRPLGKREVVLRVGNGDIVEPLTIGTAFVTLSSGHVITLKDALYLPNAFRNVLSIPRLVRDGYELSFNSHSCHIHYGDKVVGMGILVNGLYILELHENARQRDVNVASTSSGKHSRSDGVNLKQL